MIIVIAGPTGVGKTKCSIELAKLYDAEIINADSMQVYQELNIGTAKITEQEKEGIKHHLFNVVSVKNDYSIYDYQGEARRCLNELLQHHKNVIIVGGSGLYLKALLYDYKMVDEVKYNYGDLSLEELANKVKDLHLSDNIDYHNRRRLERLLNRYDNGITVSEEKSPKLYDFMMIGLTMKRDLLYQRIDARVDQMLRDGLEQEVRSLYDANIKTRVIDTAIGYKELYAYFDGQLAKSDAIAQIKTHSRHYAKRQYTFFNNQFENLNWFDVDINNFNQTILQIENYINSYKF